MFPRQFNVDLQARIRQGVNRGVGTFARTGAWAVGQGAEGVGTVARTGAWAVEKGAEVRISYMNICDVFLCSFPFSPSSHSIIVFVAKSRRSQGRSHTRLLQRMYCTTSSVALYVLLTAVTRKCHWGFSHDQRYLVRVTVGLLSIDGTRFALSKEALVLDHERLLVLDHGRLWF